MSTHPILPLTLFLQSKITAAAAADDDADDDDGLLDKDWRQGSLKHTPTFNLCCCCCADLSDEHWIWYSLKRDQDLTVDLYQLGLVLGRIAAMGGDRDAYQEKMRDDPDYFNGVQ